MQLKDYQCLSELIGQMRDAAHQSEWDRLIELEQEYKGKIEALKLRDDLPSSEEDREQKIALLGQILADDAEIRSLTEGWIKQLQGIMQNTRSEQRLQQTYLASY